MVVQLGDLVSEYDNLTQWGHVSNGLKPLDDANLPNTVVPGNHDFNNATGAFTQYDSFFPPSRYAGKPWTPSTSRYGGYMGQNLFGPDPVDRRNMNNFALFSAGGRDFLVLNLEWEAPQYALDWATKVLDAYPDRIAIMVTHSFVSLNGQRRTTAERPGGTPANTMWNNFVSQQCSIRLVLNGHFHDGNLGEANRSDLNSCGQPRAADPDRLPGSRQRWRRLAAVLHVRPGRQHDDGRDVLAEAEPVRDRRRLGVHPAVRPQCSATRPVHDHRYGPDRLRRGCPRHLDRSGARHAVRVAGDRRRRRHHHHLADLDGAYAAEQTDLVDDTFTRNVTNGWGAADASHAWQLTSSLTSYSVDGSVGRVTVPVGSGRTGTLTGVSGTDVRVTTDLSLAQAASGSGTYVSLMARVNGSTSYRAKLRYLSGGSLALSVGRFVNGTETTLATANVSGVTATPGLPLRLRLETEGTSPTTVRAKVWPVSGTEPATWTVTATDSTAALQSAGTAGLDLYISGSAAAASALAFDRFTVSRLGATPPVNQEPDCGHRHARDQRAHGQSQWHGLHRSRWHHRRLRLELR